MFCPKCGTSIADDAQFCPKCGEKLSQIPNTAPAQQPAQRKKSAKGWIILSAVALIAVVAALVYMFFLKGGNDYQRIFKAIGNTIRMNSAEITLHDVYYDDYATGSFCVDSGSELRYYFSNSDGYVQGYYDGYFFRCWDEGGRDFSGYKWKNSQRSVGLSYAALFHLCSGKDVKSFVREFVTPLISSSGGSLESSREATDLANMRSAYAELMSDALMMEEIETEQDRGSIKIQPTSKDEDGNFVFSARVSMTQTKPGWQTTGDRLQIAGISLSDMQPGQTAVITLRSPYQNAEFSFEGELVSAPSEDADNNVTDLEKIVDVLEDKLTDEEWMDQCCSIEKSENGDEDVYSIQFRPKKFFNIALSEIGEYLDSEMKESLEEELRYMDNSTIKLQISISDEKITKISARQLGFDMSMTYKKEKLSEILAVDEDNREYEFSFADVDKLEFDQSYVEKLLKSCEEWD